MTHDLNDMVRSKQCMKYNSVMFQIILSKRGRVPLTFLARWSVNIVSLDFKRDIICFEIFFYINLNPCYK